MGKPKEHQYDKMKPARKREFLRLLRTPADEGGYLQVEGELVGAATHPEFVDHDGFCCLGVATNEMVKKGLLTWDTVNVPPKTDAGLSLVDSAATFYIPDFTRQEAAEWKAEEEKNGAIVIKVGDVYAAYRASYEDSGMPGDAVLKYWGISTEAATKLAAMNDDGNTFEQIAYWVEAFL